MSARHCLLLLLITAATVGCGKAPPTHYYMLKIEDIPSAVTRPTDGTAIGVEVFRIDPPYDESRIVYRIGPDSLEVGYYAYHRWAVPLSRMLAHVVSEGLRDTPGVSSIEVASPGTAYPARLTGRVLALEEIDEHGGPRVLIRLQLTLRDTEGAEIWSEIVGGDRPTRASTVSEVVGELNTLLAEAVQQGRPGLERALRR